MARHHQSQLQQRRRRSKYLLLIGNLIGHAFGHLSWGQMVGVEPRSNGSIERMVYFGWVWEPGDSGNVSTATKADEAEVDLSLWNVGGDDGPGNVKAFGH
jgi:hypothetical protein